MRTKVVAKLTLSIVALGALTGAAIPALAGRCGDQNPALCGLDSQTDPPDPALGGTGGCTEASMAGLPLYRGTGACRPGWTKVIYDLDKPFPDNGLPGDTAAIGATSFLTLRAGDDSPCAQMVDDVDPTPCADPQLCKGEAKVPVTGYIVACWSPPDRNGCRTVSVHTKSLCLHAQHQLLGPGCAQEDGVDCPNVSTEQVGIAVPGGTNRRLCGPVDPTTSCRGTRHDGTPKVRVWIGGVCSTNNCANPGVAPVVENQRTCKVQWGATKLGYNIPPGRGINEPGWYDWKTGSLKMEVSSPKPTCGALGVCLGERTGKVWDFRVVAVPRSGQPLPCVGDGNACNPADCFQ
jgi:hypothetical protein